MKINNKIKQSLWQNRWKPNKTERKLTNKRLDVFDIENKATIIWKKKRKNKWLEVNIWDKVVISLFDILKPKIQFFARYNKENAEEPPLAFSYLIIEIINKQYNKVKKVKYVWKFIKVLEYDYCCPTSPRKVSQENIQAMDNWINKNLSWDIVFKNIQKNKTKEINLKKYWK